MGSFYTSHTVRGPSREELLAWLGTRPALVSKTQSGNTVVLDAACEDQNGGKLAELAIQISRHFGCAVLAMLNHDDDVLYLALYESGAQTDEYNSNPAYFSDDSESDAPAGGDANKLCMVFETTDPGRVEAILRKTEYAVATRRHLELALALGLPLHAVGLGYNYASKGEFPPGCTDGDYRHSRA